MKTSLPPLAIIGTGALCPAGRGEAALAQAPVEPTHESLLSDPATTVPVRRIDSAALAGWSQEPRLRRASPLALFLAEAARQALASGPAIPRDRIGLVAALGTGSIRFSRAFYERMLAKGRAQAAPAVFPETVYNSPVSHVAGLLGVEGACYSLMGDEAAWVEALRVAQVWLALGTADAVLVLAGEELDAIALEAYARFGWFRRGLVAAEGAGAVLVRRAVDGGGTLRVNPAPTSFSFRTREEREGACRRLAEETDRPVMAGADFMSRQSSSFGSDHGVAFTASAAWTFLQACSRGRDGSPFRLLVPGANAAVAAVDFL
jgi:3-oxoacyl-[acyl-carrier-protein] synthase III